MKKAVNKNFAIFTGKLQICSFIKKGLQYRCLPLNIAKFLRTPASDILKLLQNTGEQLVLY